MEIAPKTAGAIAGGGMSTNLVIVLDWILSFWHISLPAAVGAAIAGVFAGLGAYFSPHSRPQVEQQPVQAEQPNAPSAF